MKPNIIIIVLDEIRAKNLSLYGYHKEFDKNIKKIASESIVFNQYISDSNGSYPSATSLFTGKYAANHGIVNTFPYTPKEQIDKLRQTKFWLPLYLQKHGYDTYLISLIRAWFKKGFNYIQSDKQKDSYRRINDNALIKKAIKLFPDWFYILLKRLTKRDQKSDFPAPGETLNLAIEKIKTAKKPFFMFIHIEDAHYPWATTKTPKLKNSLSRREIIRRIKSKEQKKYVQRRMFNTNAESFEEVEAKYNKSIELVDNDLARLHSFLKKEKLWDNTILILLGDHGLSISEHQIHIHHAGLYDETTHVPLIMHIPGMKHKVIDELVQNVDIAPTLLDILKEKRSVDVDGKSIIQLIKTGKPIRDKAFSFDSSAIKRWAVRTKEKKIIFSPNKNCLACKAEHGEHVEEYDLINDPRELKNIHSNKYKLSDFNEKFKFI